MLRVGDPIDNPTDGQVLVASDLVTLPMRYHVSVLVVCEVNTWVSVIMRKKEGGQRWLLNLPVTGPLLGPVDIGDPYCYRDDTVEIRMREGVPAVEGTIQATVSLEPSR